MNLFRICIQIFKTTDRIQGNNMGRQKNKKQNSFEFSKLIYILNLSFVVIVTGLSFLCVIKSGEWNIIDLSPITVICTSAFASLSVSSLFYYRKAQAENVLKISKQIQNENIEVQNVEVANLVMNSDFGSNM